MTKNLQQKLQLGFFYIPYQKLQFTYLYAFLKDAQATGEAFSPKKKRTSSTSKHENS
jgi:hypothetical protein